MPANASEIQRNLNALLQDLGIDTSIDQLVTMSDTEVHNLLAANKGEYIDKYEGNHWNDYAPDPNNRDDSSAQRANARTKGERHFEENSRDVKRLLNQYKQHQNQEDTNTQQQTNRDETSRTEQDKRYKQQQERLAKQKALEGDINRLREYLGFNTSVPIKEFVKNFNAATVALPPNKDRGILEQFHVYVQGDVGIVDTFMYIMALLLCDPEAAKNLKKLQKLVDEYKAFNVPLASESSANDQLQIIQLRTNDNENRGKLALNQEQIDELERENILKKTDNGDFYIHTNTEPEMVNLLTRHGFTRNVFEEAISPESNPHLRNNMQQANPISCREEERQGQEPIGMSFRCGIST